MVADMADLVEELGRVEPALGGDAASMKAGTADLVLLYQRHRKAEVVGVEGGRIATRAAAEDDDVVHGTSAPIGLPRLARRGNSQEGRRDTLHRVQTRYLIIAAAISALVILVAGAVYFATL
jgi:hypothetical protein